LASAATITDASFKSEVYESGQLVLVDFWAEWCEPCRALSPVLGDVARELQGQIKIVTLDVDSNPSTADAFGVKSIPTLILFKNGKPAERIVGLRTAQELVQTLRAHTL
jgi:thioredoxin 1